MRARNAGSVAGVPQCVDGRVRFLLAHSPRGVAIGPGNGDGPHRVVQSPSGLRPRGATPRGRLPSRLGTTAKRARPRAGLRLKNEWALLPLRVRRIERVALHADLTILARLACALAKARAVPLAA